MYLYTSQELQLIHEERVGKLQEGRAYSRSERKPNRPFKQLMRLIRREEA